MYVTRNTASHFIKVTAPVNIWKPSGGTVFAKSIAEHSALFVQRSRDFVAANSRMNCGKSGEDLAARFLAENGFTILARNYRYERAEIDIVAEEGEELVFVEVKTRRSRSYGAPEEAVTEEKQEQIRSAAEGYLYQHDVDDRPCRFDIVAVEVKDGMAEIRHLRDAF
jgi:putative endonuclease